MSYPHGHTVYRLRAKTMTDPYSKKTVPADWSDPDELPIDGAFVAQSSTTSLSNATRSQALEAKSLYCDPETDVQKGDRIRDGETGAPIYTIDGIPPTGDRNPFTGWQPTREIPLTRSVG